MAVVLLKGIVLPTLQGFTVIVGVASLMGSLSSAAGITSGTFASAAAFAVVRHRGFVRLLVTSRFEETQGIIPPAVFWRLAATGPPYCFEGL
jgi:hypothetical protein